VLGFVLLVVRLLPSRPVVVHVLGIPRAALLKLRLLLPPLLIVLFSVLTGRLLWCAVLALVLMLGLGLGFGTAAAAAAVSGSTGPGAAAAAAHAGAGRCAAGGAAHAPVAGQG